MALINLYTETEYSILHSPLKIGDLIKHASEQGYSALAITDISNMYGAIKFYQQCEKAHIKPIIGLQINVAFEQNVMTILLYAKNEKGYINLIQLATAARLVKKPLPLDMVNDHLDDIIVVLADEFRSDTFSYLFKHIQSDSIFIGVDPITLLPTTVDEILSFGNANRVKCCFIHKTSFSKPEDFEIYKILNAIGKSDDVAQTLILDKNNYLLTKKEYNEISLKYPQLFAVSEYISSLCTLTIEFGKYKMPVYDDSINTDQFINELALLGLKKRLAGKNVDNKIYINRLNDELAVIKKMGFNDYFLIVYDFIKYAKKQGILVGPGRGSAPGSLVAYALGITEADPIKYDLLFERFLNVERISMPDIDTDFPDDRRDDVIRYMGNKYGKTRVAYVTTFGTFGPRMAIRDIAKVLNLSNIYLEEVLSCVDNKVKELKDVLENNEKLQMMVAGDQMIAKLIEVALKIEGLPRHTSTHASGIIMADKELNNYTPLQEGLNGLYQTQFPAEDLEALGLVKIDFLGLRNLTTIAKVVAIIKKQYMKDFSINNIPYDDQETFEMLAKGKTEGIFQLESKGMKETLIDLKTNSFDDIVNAIALYRPATKMMIQSFAKRKHHDEKVTFVHPDLKEILSSTYGTIVFQEQVMRTAQKIAGYSLGEADVLRRAVAKKNTSVLENERSKFVSRASTLGYQEQTANQIYDYIVKFGDYGFNKSHSVVYSMISYQMAYLKVHFYGCFMVALMGDCIGNVGLIKSYINDLNKHHITVLPPSVNESTANFEIVFDSPSTIYYSLLGVNGIGGATVEMLVSERNENGKFEDYDQFIARTKKILHKKDIENLIYAGACDCFGHSRKAMIEHIDDSLHLSLYGDSLKDKLSKRVFDDEEYSITEISLHEKEALGFNIKYDIFKRFIPLKEKYHTQSIATLRGGAVQLIVSIENIKVILTKNGDEMAFISLLDETDSIDAVMFPVVFKENKEQFNVGDIVFIRGRCEKRKEKLQVIIEKIGVLNYQ